MNPISVFVKSVFLASFKIEIFLLSNNSISKTSANYIVFMEGTFHSSIAATTTLKFIPITSSSLHYSAQTAPLPPLCTRPPLPRTPLLPTTRPQVTAPGRVTRVTALPAASRPAPVRRTPRRRRLHCRHRRIEPRPARRQRAGADRRRGRPSGGPRPTAATAPQTAAGRAK